MLPGEPDPNPEPEAEAEESPFGALLAQVPPDLRDVSFSTAVRGYDRREVDDYVKRVNRVIAELEISHSPQAAVKHALDRVGEQTSGVLQRAREAAEELTTTAFAESEHATRRAKVEAAEMVEKAQADADRLRVDAAQEAEELRTSAHAEAEKRLGDVEARARERERKLEERLGTLGRQVADVEARRAQALAGLRDTARELERFAAREAVGAEDDGAPAAQAPGAQETVSSPRSPPRRRWRCRRPPPAPIARRAAIARRADGRGALMDAAGFEPATSRV